MNTVTQFTYKKNEMHFTVAFTR